jgi:sec-independent protein translocase protein TatA
MGLDNPLHIAILVVLLLLIFGARRLPEMGRSLGSGMREFKEGISSSASGNDAKPALPEANKAQQQVDQQASAAASQEQAAQAFGDDAKAAEQTKTKV